MIIQCDKCQTKYKLDDSKVTGAGVKVKCTKCQHIFIVAPPAPPPSPEIAPVVEEPPVKKVEAPAPEPPKKEAPPEQNQAPAADDTGTGFGFDFEDDGAKQKQTPKDSFDESGFSLDEGKAGSEFSFDSFGFDDKKKETAKDQPASQNPFDGLDIDFEKKPAGDSAPSAPEPSSDWDLSFRDDEPRAEDTEKEITKGEDEKGFSPQAAPAAAAGYSKAGLSGEKDTIEEDAGGLGEKFSDLLDESVAKGGKKPAEVEEEPEEEPAHYTPKPAPARKNSKAVLLAIFLIIAAGAAFYFSGMIDMIAGKSSGPAETAQRKNLEIEAMKGYYAENKDLGKIFVIEAQVKNTDDDIQRIQSITGVLYNSKGEKISQKSVSPGRVVTQDDLKNLGKDDLLKPFSDSSGGIVPPRGTVPVMVLFTEMPEGMTEYGLDIVR